MEGSLPSASTSTRSTRSTSGCGPERSSSLRLLHRADHRRRRPRLDVRLAFAGAVAFALLRDGGGVGKVFQHDVEELPGPPPDRLFALLAHDGSFGPVGHATPASTPRMED